MSNFCLKKDQTLKASAAHLYPEFTQSAPRGPFAFLPHTNVGSLILFLLSLVMKRKLFQRVTCVPYL